MFEKLKVGITDVTNMGSFKQYIPNITLISPPITPRFDLVIFPGGSDVSPNLYGERNYRSYTDPDRDKKEVSLFKYYINESYTKMLGVCRGHQFLNVMLGGILVQDLYAVLGTFHEDYHSLERLGETKLPDLFPGGLVTSTHHQGVKSVGRIKATTSYKGIIESCESEKIITVQFHPEFMGKNGNLFFQYIEEWAAKKKEKEVEFKRFFVGVNENKKNEYFDLNVMGDFEVPLDFFNNEEENLFEEERDDDDDLDAEEDNL